MLIYYFNIIYSISSIPTKELQADMSFDVMTIFQDYLQQSRVHDASIQTKKTRKFEQPLRNSIRRMWLPIGGETFSWSLVFRKNPVIRRKDVPSVSILLRDAERAGYSGPGRPFPTALSVVAHPCRRYSRLRRPAQSHSSRRRVWVFISSAALCAERERIVLRRSWESKCEL